MPAAGDIGRHLRFGDVGGDDLWRRHRQFFSIEHEPASARRKDVSAPVGAGPIGKRDEHATGCAASIDRSLVCGARTAAAMVHHSVRRRPTLHSPKRRWINDVFEKRAQDREQPSSAGLIEEHAGKKCRHGNNESRNRKPDPSTHGSHPSLPRPNRRLSDVASVWQRTARYYSSTSIFLGQSQCGLTGLHDRESDRRALSTCGTDRFDVSGSQRALARRSDRAVVGDATNGEQRTSASARHLNRGVRTRRWAVRVHARRPSGSRCRNQTRA